MTYTIEKHGQLYICEKTDLSLLLSKQEINLVLKRSYKGLNTNFV